MDTAKSTAIVFGIVFVLIGILGFIPNPIVGPESLIVTNAAHNIVHLLIGGYLLFAGYSTHAASVTALFVTGGIYLLLAIVGFLLIGTVGEAMMFGFVHFNAAGNWFHLIVALVLLAAAFATRPVRTGPRTPRTLEAR
ncbi:MAG: DUF4383 domain-containing protein [Bryobacteraceae bacterium]